MRRKKSLYFMMLHVLLWCGLLQPDGFAEHTLVKHEYGFKPIQHFIVGNNVVVVADGGQLQQNSVSHTMSYVADCFIKIQIKDMCVCAAPDQKFYSCTRNDWVSAQALCVSEQLLCGSGNVVSVDAVEKVHKQQRMHAFTVETSHIFCVTPYEIIAHNINPVITVPLTVACPPAGIAAAVVQGVAWSILGCVMYCKHRRAHRYELQHKGCFSPESRNGTTMPVATGCYEPVQNVPIVCDIKAGKADLPTKLVHEIPKDVVGTGCAFPVIIEIPELHHAATTQIDCGEVKRYNGPWYDRTEDWVKDFEHAGKLGRSIYINQGKRAYEVLEKIKGCDGFKKGDYVIIDALHKNHLEVFGKNKQWKQVANFDGTKNEKKTEQGKEELRRPLERG